MHSATLSEINKGRLEKGQSPLSCSYGFILPPEKLLLTKFSPAPTTFIGFLGKSTHTCKEYSYSTKAAGKTSPSSLALIWKLCAWSVSPAAPGEQEGICKHSAQPELLSQWENFKESTWKRKQKQTRVTFSSGSTEMRSRNGRQMRTSAPNSAPDYTSFSK